jgi:serine/threonine protein kinase
MAYNQTPAVHTAISASQTELDSFFPPVDAEVDPFSDAQIKRIKALLQIVKPEWSSSPRSYIVLRVIGYLSKFTELLNSGFRDNWFPVQAAHLPPTFQPTVKNSFVQAQELVLTKGVDLWKGEYCHFGPGEDPPFTIEGNLGGTENSVVDQIRSSVNNDVFVLKRITRANNFNPTTVQDMDRFDQEVRIIKQLNHRHFVKYVASYTDGQFLGLVMSPVAEYDMRTFLDKMASVSASNEFRRFKLRDLQSYFGCLASSLKYLHDKNIRHRDIKPQNILIKDRVVLFTDFGISYDFSDATGGRSTTRSERPDRTVRYCSPEVMDPGARHNTSSDIWSLGCVFLEMMAVVGDDMVRTSTDIQDFLSGNGSRQLNYNRNIDGTKRLLHRMHEIATPANKKAISWVQPMLQEVPENRPTAATLVQQIISTDYHGQSPTTFCGICCVNGNHNQPQALPALMPTNAGPQTPQMEIYRGKGYNGAVITMKVYPPGEGGIGSTGGWITMMLPSQFRQAQPREYIDEIGQPIHWVKVSSKSWMGSGFEAKYMTKRDILRDVHNMGLTRIS